MAINWKVDNKTGVDCSGSDGNSNRVLTLSNTSLTTQTFFGVYVSGLSLILNTEYTVVHSATATQVTFLNPLWNDMTVIVAYSDGMINSYDYYTTIGTGSNCDGADGASNRVWTLPNASRTLQQGFLVFASELCLAYGTEYTAVQKTASTTVTFLNPLWNDMPLEVRYLKFDGLVTLSDSIRLGDSISILKTLEKELKDTLRLLDTSLFTKILLKSYSETMELLDTRISLAGKNLIESLLLSETLSKLLSKNLSLNDRLLLSSSFSKVWSLERTYSDRLLLNGLINYTKIVLKLLSDTLNLSASETYLKIRYALLLESLRLSDYFIGNISPNLMLELNNITPDLLSSLVLTPEWLSIESYK